MRDSYALYTDQLKDEYKEVFAQVETYVSTQNVDDDTVEANMGELLDTFLNAQKDEKPVEEIVGNDIESFCKNFCSEFGWGNKAMNIIEKWRNVAWLIFILETLDVIFILIGVLLGEDSLSSLWKTDSTFNLTGYFMGFVIVGLIYTVIDYITRKIMFKLKKNSITSKIWTVVKIGVAVGCFFIIFMMMGNEKLNLFALPSCVLAAASGIFLAVYYMINKDRVKERKEHKISFIHMVKNEVKANLDEEMEKVYQKKNRRLAKKGKPILTKKEFIDWKEKEINKSIKLKRLYDWAPLIIAIPFGIVEYLNHGFSADFIMYIVILLTCEFLVFKGLWKIVNSSNKMDMEWIEKQKKMLSEEESI